MKKRPEAKQTGCSKADPQFPQTHRQTGVITIHYAA